MLRDGTTYPRKCIRIYSVFILSVVIVRVDWAKSVLTEANLGSNSTSISGILVFRSLSGPNRPSQIGAHVVLYDLECCIWSGIKQSVLEFFSAPQVGRKRFQDACGCVPKIATKQRPKLQNYLFLKLDAMLSPFGGSMHSIYLSAIDDYYDFLIR